ncbi:MAG: undecaprenyl-diphosphatase UppP [Candidatus Peribacteraceae bacterium]
MLLWHALLLGIVEGITEFLPISSTAHLLLTQKLLGVPFTADLASFDIAIQMGAILAVIISSGKRFIIEKRMIGLVALSFVPTALIGLLMHDIVTSVLFQNTSGMLIALVVGGLVMIIVERVLPPRTRERLTWKDALLVGILQSIAMMPGVSRSGATIIGAMLLGITRREAVEFSFLIAIPTMMAATGLDLVKNPSILTSDPVPFAIGFVAAFVTALFVIKWLRTFISTHDFTAFGIYRIVVALGLFWIFA